MFFINRLRFYLLYLYGEREWSHSYRLKRIYNYFIGFKQIRHTNEFSRMMRKVYINCHRNNNTEHIFSIISNNKLNFSSNQKYIVDAILDSNNIKTIKKFSLHGARVPLFYKIISHKYKFIYLVNPKVASRSIIHSLKIIDPNLVFDNYSYDYRYLIEKHQIDHTYYIFSFARHPIGRTLSLYMEKLNNKKSNSHINKWRDNIFATSFGLNHVVSLLEFVEWLNTPFGSDDFAEQHYMSQYLIINFMNNRINYVGRFENLDIDFQTLCDILNIPHYPLKEMNHSDNNNNNNIDKYISELIYKRYTKDFELYGYNVY